MGKFKCSVCSFIHDGDEAPEKCPRCGAPKEKFAKLSPEAAALVDRSRRTNILHAQLAALLEEVGNVACKGIEDNLDPGCVKIFTRARDEAGLLQKFVAAEIEVHVGKGKWG